MTIEGILDKIVENFRACTFIDGIVLGGSRATDTATDDSDIDIGIYYKNDSIDYDLMNAIAKRIDDTHRENLICHEGEWGNWVNCGGWLVIDGCHVDIIMRNTARVLDIIRKTTNGEITMNYQTGHPHTYIDVMYRGELASCKILYSGNVDFTRLQDQAQRYPPALQKALMDFFLFESNFSCMLAKKNIKYEDIYYITGHIFRSVSAINQVLFALNREWCLNEKKAVFRIDKFMLKPKDYSQKINCIFKDISISLPDSVKNLETLYDEVSTLCAEVQNSTDGD